MVAVETLSQFQPDSLGVADIGSGWLGMKWLRDFHPVVWKTMDVGGDEALPGEITFQMPGNGPPTRIAPLVQLNERLVLSPPESLLPELRVRMISHLTNVMKASIKE